MARSGVLLCYPYEEKRLKKWASPQIIAQPKLDGERCRAIITNGHVLLISSECNKIMSVPHINEELSNVFAGETLELDGELYIHGVDFNNLHGIIGRTANMHENSATMQYHIFDIVRTGSQVERTNKLHEIFSKINLPSVKIVETSIIEANSEAVYAALERQCEDGYEGIILRHPLAPYVRKRSVYVMKFKPRKSDVYQIIGVQEEIDKNGVPKGTLGALICTSDEGTHFGVGSGFSALQRRDLWQIREELTGAGAYVMVKYQSISHKHIPRFPIFAEIYTNNPEAPMTGNLTKDGE